MICIYAGDGRMLYIMRILFNLFPCREFYYNYSPSVWSRTRVICTYGCQYVFLLITVVWRNNETRKRGTVCIYTKHGYVI